MKLRDRADEAYRDWQRTSGHYLVGTYVPFTDGFLLGYAAANNGLKVVELGIPNKGAERAANTLGLATEEVSSW